MQLLALQLCCFFFFTVNRKAEQFGLHLLFLFFTYFIGEQLMMVPFEQIKELPYPQRRVSKPEKLRYLYYLR